MSIENYARRTCHMTPLIAVLIIGLASYRLWRLVGQDQITAWFRLWLMALTAQAHRAPRTAHAAEWTMDLVSCAWCLGAWISFTLTAVSAIVWGWSFWLAVLVALGSSTVCGALDTYLSSDSMTS